MNATEGNGLPNLSEWYEVPDGAIIPAGTTYVYKSPDPGDFEFVRLTMDRFIGVGLNVRAGRIYTEKRLEARPYHKYIKPIVEAENVDEALKVIYTITQEAEANMMRWLSNDNKQSMGDNDEQE